ncbi:MAG: hypothetical protein HYZ83_03915 [Candidatus Omnitrophica bacterium]|nr:hypothetical protein [Candidatus Omnitrophota bacterium]
MQSDLFEIPSQLPVTQPASKLAFLERSRLSLRLDHLVASVIVLMVFYVFIFSFGVEKGKRFAMAEIKAERDKRQYVTEELARRVFEEKQIGPVHAEMGNLPPGVLPAKSSAPAAEKSQPASSSDAEHTTVIAVHGKYTIQLITYTSDRQAEEKLKMLTEKGRKGFVISSGKFKQVCVDAFPSKANAMETLRQLKADGVAPRDAYVRPMPQGMI